MKADATLPWKTAGIFVLGFLRFASASEPAVYTNHFLVEFHKGGEAEAKQLAAEYGFNGVRKVRSSLFSQPSRLLIVHDGCRNPQAKLAGSVHVSLGHRQGFRQEFWETLHLECLLAIQMLQLGVLSTAFWGMDCLHVCTPRD